MTKGYARENTQEIAVGHSALRKCRNAVSAGVLSPISSAAGRNGAVGDKESARAGARNYPRWRQIMRLRRCAATPHPPPSGAPSPQGEGLRVRHSHRGPLKGKANGGASFNAANPSRGRLEGAPLTPRTHQGEGLAPAGGCSKKVHGFPAKLKGRIKESEYAIKQKER